MTDPRPLTPRPWKALKAGDDLYYVLGNEGSECLAFTTEENARLMAASHDLLLALMAYTRLGNGYAAIPTATVAAARAAIGKALNQGEE